MQERPSKDNREKGFQRGKTISDYLKTKSLSEKISYINDNTMTGEGSYDGQGISLYYKDENIAPLRLGSVEDLQLNEQRTGLVAYIRTSIGGIPTYVVDNHQHVLFGWAEALKEGHIVSGAILLHIDEHADDDDPFRTPRSLEDLTEVRRFTTEIDYKSFISPVMPQLVKRFVWLVPFAAPDFEHTPLMAPPGQALFTSVGISSRFVSRVLNGEFDPKRLIVDIDMDYFRPFISPKSHLEIIDNRGYDLEAIMNDDLQAIIALTRKAGVVTMATSPGFIDQSKAIALVREIIEG